MKSILLIGLGNFGKHIALQLKQLGHQVMAVDHNEDRINDVMDIVTNAQIGDSTNLEFLRSLGIDNYDVCIVAKLCKFLYHDSFRLYFMLPLGI